MDENNFVFTVDQQKTICEYYHKNYDELDYSEICELLDNLIQEIEYKVLSKTL